LSKSINSIFAQQYSPLECIVVDDGSTDETETLIKQWLGGTQLRYIRVNHGGLSYARNIGIENANGEYIAFLDADDVWMPEKLRDQVELMLAQPSLDFCFCDVVLEGEYKGITKGTVTEGEDFARNIFVNGITVAQAPSTWLVKKRLLKAIGGFDETIHHGSDVELLFRLACNGRGGCVEKALAIRVLRSDSMSTNLRSKIDMATKVIEKMIRYREGRYHDVHAAAMFNLHRYLSRHAWISRSWKDSLIQAMKASYWNPSFVLSSEFWANLICSHPIRLAKKKLDLILKPRTIPH